MHLSISMTTIMISSRKYLSVNLVYYGASIVHGGARAADMPNPQTSSSPVRVCHAADGLRYRVVHRVEVGVEGQPRGGRRRGRHLWDGSGGRELGHDAGEGAVLRLEPLVLRLQLRDLLSNNGK